MKLILLVGLSIVAFASAEEVKCLFDYLNWYYLNRSVWTCYRYNQPITDRDSTISSFDTRTTVEALYIHSKPQVKFIPVNLTQKLPDLIAVQFWNCSLTSVEDHHFQGLRKLILLSLGHNQIETISSNAFKDNTNLGYLALNNNKIQFINDKIFSQFQDLKQIYLYDNLIRFIDPLAFQNLRSIEHINLSRNNLTFLDPKSLENLFNVKNLTVSDNQLESIDANLLRNCNNLEKIWIEGNKLKSIDAEAFDGLKNLKLLDLRSNICIDRLYESSVDLPELKSALKSKCKSEVEVLRAANEKYSLEKEDWINKFARLKDFNKKLKDFILND